MAALVPVPEVPTLAFESLRVDESETPLGRGASGAVYPGLWLKEEPLNAYDSCPNVYRVVPTPAAVKVYNHGAKTSDGRPKDEMHASILASKTGCKSIVRTIATFQKEWTLRNERDGFPEEGLVMEFLEQDEWVSLGSPPSFDSVTRDTYASNVTRSRGEIVEVARGVAAAGAAFVFALAYSALAGATNARVCDARSEENRPPDVLAADAAAIRRSALIACI